MSHLRHRIAVAASLLACLVAAGRLLAADDPSRLPVVDAGDAAALKANLDKDIFLVGTCKEASWSDTGKVMNITFVGAEQTGTQAVAFAQNRKKLDDAFNGDLAKTLTGAKLKIRGKLREYAGKSGQKARPEVTITDPSQVTILIDEK